MASTQGSARTVVTYGPATKFVDPMTGREFEETFGSNGLGLRSGQTEEEIEALLARRAEEAKKRAAEQK